MSESEITDVYNKMLEDLVRLCRILLNYQMIHGVDAEDIVQEVLIRLMQSAGVFEDESHEKAWLLKVASNLCKDKLKSASRQREVAIPEGYDVADEKQEQKEESDILQIISQLPEKYRSAIHLYYYEEYSVKEIAEILEKKETTIRSLLKRGREKLARILPQ